MQGMPGVGALLGPVPFLIFFSESRRRLVACTPALLALAIFFIGCVTSGFSTRAPDVVQYAYTAAMAFTALMVLPSLYALRNKWVALLHLFTFAGIAFLWFVGAMALAHDWS
jgi:hypothetical protein